VTEILKKNERVLRVVQESTCQVFATMLGITVTPGNLSVVEGRVTVPTAGLVAMVGMAGAVSGNGCLCMSKAFACHAASRFLMAEYDDVNDEVLDAVAELANMIVGGLKTTLEEQVGLMGLSVPTIVYGEKYVTRSPSLGERMSVTFHCEDGIVEDFTVTICLITENQNRSYLRELAEFHAHLA
jgi:chemotaxis protein CheX